MIPRLASLMALLLLPVTASARPSEGHAFVGLDLARDRTPMVEGYGAALHGGYQWGLLGLEGRVAFHPDMGESDLTGLVPTLVQIAHTGTQSANFQQPLTKTPLMAGAALRLSPVHGTIQPFGALDLDAAWVLFAGPAVLTRTRYYASYDADGVEVGDVLRLDEVGNDLVFGSNYGTQAEVGLGERLMLRLDLRWFSYVDDAPQYDPDQPVGEKRVYTPFTASLGLDLLLGGGR